MFGNLNTYATTMHFNGQGFAAVIIHASPQQTAALMINGALTERALTAVPS
jgi:hypothetical protein